MVEQQKEIPVSVVIPTYGRDDVLLETISQLLQQGPAATEVIVVDQTITHEQETNTKLGLWHSEGKIRWIKHGKPSQPGALNIGLQQATQPFVLFLDDDIRIDQGFIEAHYNAFDSDEIWGVAGQVLQPGEEEDKVYAYRPKPGPLVDVDFTFRSGRKFYVQNGMSGNFCVRRERALQIGGFDENFIPPVSYRFDNEFCKRLCRAGGKIIFGPKARIYHLRSDRGGTRTNSNHMASMSPEHGVGDYYFAFKLGLSLETCRYVLRRPFREVRTKFHLCRPWWIPVKLIGEFYAFFLAITLYLRGPRCLHVPGTNVKPGDNKENGPREFYDREYLGDKYANVLRPEEHPFYSELKFFIDKYQLYKKQCLEIGCGRGLFQDLVLNYVGVDISSSVYKYFHKPYYQSSAAELPFKDNTFDAVWTYAVLEHVVQPEKALSEMRRVLKNNGVLLLLAAWQCRSWAADGLPVRPYSDLDFKGKLLKALVPARNSVLFRSAFIFPKRLIRFIKFSLSKGHLEFKYKKLKPNYTHFWMPDSDAVNSMDPYETILWFMSRGDRCITYTNWFKKFFIRSDSIIFQIKKD